MYDRRAVGSIEVDKYLQGGSMAMLGITSFIKSYTHKLYIQRRNNVLYF